MNSMTNHNFEPSDEKDKLLISDDVFIALTIAMQNLSKYGEYSRNDKAVFGNINPFKNNIVFTPNMPLSDRPTHQDSGEMFVRDETYPDEILVYKMKVWTPYEGASTRPFNVNGREDSISHLWHDAGIHEGINPDFFILATTIGRRVYQIYREAPWEDLIVDEADEEKAEMYIDEINQAIDSLAKTHPEVT